MVAQTKYPYITPEEYLGREEHAEHRSEYVDGVIVAMSGASPDHAAITANLTAAVRPAIRAERCRCYSADLGVRIETSNRYYYPDLTVVCGTPKYDERRGFRHLLNPTVVFEVLSDSTEKRDRGEKWEAYWEIESLIAYVLIHQDKPMVELFTRAHGADAWQATRVMGLDSVLKLACVGTEIPMSAIYEDIEFGSTDPADTEKLDD